MYVCVFCTFWILTSYQIYHVQIFSHSVSRLAFHFFDGFLHCAKAFQFEVVPFVDFGFVSLARGDRSKKIFLNPMSKSTLLTFPRGVLLCSPTFRSLIHFEFGSVHGVRECSNFILLDVAVQLFQQHLLKRLVFSQLYILASFAIE